MNTSKKPNISSQIPEGFELVYNNITERWALRPIEGFSKKYLTKNTFIPKPVVNKTCDNSDIKEPNDSKTKSNKNLTKAKRVKNDEFYTRLEDITNELKHYKGHFKGKVIYCPCDKLFNLNRSNFARYFIGKFHSLGIKKLICTQYNPNGKGEIKIIDFQKHGFKWEYNGEYEDSFTIDESLIDTFMLNGDGSFDSIECKNIMKECDIVITNPPFSIFREFVNQILSFNKKFLIIGSQNAITYKEIFPLIKNNEMWLGYNNPKIFEVPITKIENEKIQFEDDNGIFYQKFGNICWFTNLMHEKRYEPLYLKRKYDSEFYQKYDNYNAIDVSKVADIPMDYEGVMGVPITFLEKYCPTQFEIVDAREYTNIDKLKRKSTYLVKDKDSAINGKPTYARILIKKVTNI